MTSINHFTGYLVMLVFCSLSLVSCGQEANDTKPERTTVEIAEKTEPAVESEGAKQFKLRCSTCHSLNAGKASVVGPELTDIVGRTIGSVEGFAYSKALKESEAVWTTETLDKFLTNPAKQFPGNKMAFGGLADSKQRQLIITYLETSN